MRPGLLASALACCIAPAGLPGAPIPEGVSRTAYEQPLPGLTDAGRERFFRGRALFRQVWTPAPAPDTAIDGLGPTYNRQSCVACHPHNARGAPPAGPGDALRSMLVRLSVPGQSPEGGPKPHPAYGDQLNEEAIPGVPAEGRTALRWREVTHPLPARAPVRLRSPALEFRDLAFGPLDGALSSPRVAPPVFGLGLLEAVPAETIRAYADAAKPDGVTGHANAVWDAVKSRKALGRFGAKANAADLANQIAGAMLGDLGMTTGTHPEQNCPAPQTACRAAPGGGLPELTAAQAADLEFYLVMLAAPAPRHSADALVRRGARAFTLAGCEVCHRATLTTARHARYALLANQEIHPYTDLLVHDLGAGLSDGRPDFTAGAREWRTAPLWGLGLSATIAEQPTLLHDGRARGIEEAILWHDGEARIARERYEHLPGQERRALLEFLDSL